MSVESKYKPVSYTGTGGTSVFPFGWVCYEKTWIHVSADGLELTQGADYTVALESISGGSITLTAPLAAGKVLIIWMDVPITQENRYPNTGQLNTVTIEKALDKQTLIAQQQQDAIERSVKVPVGSQEKPEDVVQGIYGARDAAAASANTASAQATAAKNSADASALSAATAEQNVQTATAQAVADATAQANAAANAAAAAEQSALDAAASVPENIVERVTATETKNTQQDTRLTAVESGVTAISTTLIGSIQTMLCADSYVPNGCVPANGGEYTRTQFPTLYDDYLVGGKLLTCTYTAQATQVGLTGNCGKFALDTVNQKFKVPLLKDGDSITQAASAAEIGKSVKAGLPNFTATVVSRGLIQTASGAAKKSGNGGSDLSGSGYNDTVVIDPSTVNSIYGNSTTVTDEQIRLRHFVVVASAQNNASVFDWSAYMDALAGKANVDMSNITGNAIGVYAYFRDEKPAGINGGSTSAATWQTRDLNKVVHNAIPDAALTANGVSLPAGRYYIRASIPAFGVNSVRGAVFNRTTSQYLLYSPSYYADSTYNGRPVMLIEDEFILSAPAVIELRMWNQTAYLYGMGINTSPSGVVEIYSEARIWKL